MSKRVNKLADACFLVNELTGAVSKVSVIAGLTRNPLKSNTLFSGDSASSAE
jgi:hypothetical protein